MTKPILCLDFDGVIHSYSSGWQGIDVIPDPPVPGVFDWIRRAANHFRIVIYSSRSKEAAGIKAMLDWFKRHDDEVYVRGDTAFELQEAASIVTPITHLVAFANEKPSAFLTIDDRAIRFQGDWSKIDPVDLLTFQPWNRRPRAVVGDSMRDQIIKNMPEATVEAYDVWRCFERARAYGLEVEWFEDFLANIKAGDEPELAAQGACYEWDV